MRTGCCFSPVSKAPPGAQRALKRALLKAYHGDGRNIGSHDVLLELAAEAGLPAERAREVLERGEFADEVRHAERFWQEVGIHSVPAVIVDRKHLISGGQPSAVFEQALRQIAAESAAPQPSGKGAAGPLQWRPFRDRGRERFVERLERHGPRPSARTPPVRIPSFRR